MRYDVFSSAVFLPYLSMLILSLLLLGLGSKSTSLSPGFCVRRPRQYDTICQKLNLFSGFFVVSGYLFRRMESINVARVLQEAGDADSRAQPHLLCAQLIKIVASFTYYHRCFCMAR